MAESSTGRLLERSLVTGIVGGAVLGACFMLGLAVLESRSANATELEFVPIAVVAAAVVGAVVGAPVGLVAGMAARAPLSRGSVTAARAIVASVGAIGAGATVAGWVLTSVLLRPHD